MSADPARLMSAARSLLLAGDLTGAREHIEAAAEAWRLAGNALEAARCDRMVATLAVSGGADPDPSTVEGWSLAVGWVTLRDLLGATAARTVFQPRLLALRTRWGLARFAAVKRSYESGQSDQAGDRPADKRQAEDGGAESDQVRTAAQRVQVG